MEFNFDSIISDVYYTLDTDLNFKEFKDLDSALLAKRKLYLIVQETKGTWTNYVSFRYIFRNDGIKIKVFDELGNNVSILKEKEWSLDSMIMEHGGDYQMTRYSARIIDPRGETLPRQFYGDGFRGFINCIKLFREVSQFDCIENYELYKKNRELKVQCKTLILENQALKERFTLTQPYQFDDWERNQLLRENKELQAKLELLIQENNKLQTMLGNPD